jgi:hypothetical protein
LTVLGGLGGAAGATEEGIDPFDDDLQARVARVNEGGLRFLATPPDRKVHHHHNEITLDARSIEDGWARLVQCHEHLDAVPRAQVVYRPEHIRHLKVLEARGIESAWVEGPSVQLQGVGSQAHLCVDAESRVLHRNGDGSVSVRNGPFMRRFLDGYYPMRVSLTVHYPCDALRFTGVDPAVQPGFALVQAPCRVDLNAWFEGRLNTELHFLPVAPEGAKQP